MHEDTTQIDNESRPPVVPPTPTTGRFRSIVAVGAAIAIVALFAGLIYTFGPGRTTTATTQRNDSGWLAVATLQNQPAVPIFAMSNPAIVYEAAPSVLRRSDDGGKSWQTLTLPSDSGSNPAYVSIMVSPLDARKAILQVTAVQARGVTMCPTAFSPGHDAAVASSGAVPLSSNIPSSGSITCTVQYYSADGGQHWAHLQAPSGIVLGNELLHASIVGYTPSTPIFAQGSRLFTYADCSFGCEGAGSGYRIVMSTDGGATWSYADDALANQGAHVCSFMPTASGSTLFALTSTEGCPRDAGAPNPTLWSSTDRGATWSQATLPAGGQNPQSVLVVSHGSDRPLLYLNLHARPEPYIDAGPGTPADLRVSADGGQHWSAAPASGVPAGYVSILGPIGALSDGTVVEPFSSRCGCSLAWPVFYEWKQGDAAWHSISKPLIEHTMQDIVSLTIVPAGSTGSDQIRLVMLQGNVTQNTPTYNVSVITVGK